MNSSSRARGRRVGQARLEGLDALEQVELRRDGGVDRHAGSSRRQATRGGAGGTRHGRTASLADRCPGHSALPLSGTPVRRGRRSAPVWPMDRRAPRPREIERAAVRTAGPSSRGSAFSCGTTTDSAATTRSSAPKIGAATLTSGCGRPAAEGRQPVAADLGERAAQRGGGDRRPSPARAPAAGRAPPPGSSGSAKASRTRPTPVECSGQPAADPVEHVHRLVRGEPLDQQRLAALADGEQDVLAGDLLEVAHERQRDLLEPLAARRERGDLPQPQADGEPAVGAALQRAPGHQPAGQPQRRSWSGCRCAGSARRG